MFARAWAVLAAWSIAGAIGASAAPAAREKDHEELRGMLRMVTEALNTRDFDALSPFLDEPVSFTMVDQKRLKSLSELKAYFAQLYDRPGAKLERIEFRPEAEELTWFLGRDVGVSHGVSDDRYLMRNAETRSMRSRWSATLYKRGGRWRLSSLHIGANILDNPLLNAAKGMARWTAAGAFLFGLLAGFLGARFLGGASRPSGA